MRPNQFTQNHEVILSIKELKDSFKQQDTKLIVSDIIDQTGHQYVDLVQEGGGILGIALVGYIYVLEEMGIRFLNLGGASAGSISTLFLAAIGKPNEKKSAKLIEILANKDFYDFVDGDKDARKFIKAIIQKSGKFKTIFRGLKIIDNMKRDMGLNPGKDIQKWVRDTIQEFGINTTKDLIDKIQDLPDSIKLRQDNSPLNQKDLNPSYKIIASDLSTNTKAVFPDMGNLYYENVLETNPSEFVRASMSIPIFFAPFKIKNIPKGKLQQLMWDELANYQGEIPDEVFMVDGGIMSNFPIDVFHLKNNIPRKPTFGVKLGLDRKEVNDIENYFHLIYSCFQSARQIRDFEFVFNNDEFTKLVTHIDVEGFNWLNFDIDEPDKIKLFVSGVKAACNFLKDFNWQEYKNLRFKKMVTETENVAMIRGQRLANE